MIEQNVQVIRCHGDRFWARLGSQSGCTACDNGNGCGAGVFAKLLQGKPAIIELARNDMRIEPGQMVTLAFPEKIYMKLVLTSYGWPLLAALVGALAGHGLGLWLQFRPALIDALSLSSGLLAGGLLVRLLKNQINASAVLNSLGMTVYYPSTTPNMCSRGVDMEEPQQF